MAISKGDLIEGVAKGMAVLESFNTERQRLNATTAAQRAGISRACARRHLLTLLHLGYLESDGSYYWLSSKVLRFSGSYLATSRLPRTLQPTLDKLAFQTQHSFSAVVQDGDEVVIVARSGLERLPSSNPAGHAVAYGLHLGARLPVHATSTGRMLLAAMPKTQFNAWVKERHLPRLTKFTITEVKALRSEIELARKADHCLVSEEHELGVHALAVALRNATGTTVAALNVVVSSSQMSAVALKQDMLAYLYEAAQEVRAIL